MEVANAALGTLLVLAGRYDPGALLAADGFGALTLVLASVIWAAYTVGGEFVSPLWNGRSALER